MVRAAGAAYALGRAIGEATALATREALARYEFLVRHLLPFHATAAGRRAYDAFLALHRARYPGAVRELEGMADGAGVPFEHLLLVNLRGEYRGLLAAHGPDRGCTDCAVVSGATALLGHNEDGSPAFLGRTFVLEARPADGVAFRALCYPGFLPGNACGWNERGLAIAIDNVQVASGAPGVGRHFVARSLLEAPGIEEARARATVPDRAAGFTYNLASTAERRVACLEVAPRSHALREVRGWHVHTNHCRWLDVPGQGIGASSAARLERAQALLASDPPPARETVLRVLGDRAGGYPILRDATPPDPSCTLHTVLFDAGAGTVEIFSGRPGPGAPAPATFAW